MLMRLAICLGLSCFATLVHSQTAVGYINATLTPGFNALATQLASTETDTVGEQFADAPEGAMLFKIVDGVFTTNLFSNGTWERPDEPLALGEGYLVLNPLNQNWTVTFWGEILTGSLTNHIPAGLSMRGSRIPLEGGLTTKAGVTLNAFDNVYLLNGGAWDVYTFLPNGAWHPAEPILHAAEGFMVRASAGTNSVIFLPKPPPVASANAPEETLARHSTAGAGTVNFANAAAGVLAPVAMLAGSLPVSEWRVQLLAQAGEEFQLIAETEFETNNLAGLFLAGRVDVPESAPGNTRTFKLRVTSEGQTVAESNGVTVNLGGGIYPPANLTGLLPFEVLEQLRLSVRLENDLTVLSWRNERPTAQVQASSAVSGGWETLSLSKTEAEGIVSVAVSRDPNRRFFRLIVP